VIEERDTVSRNFDVSRSCYLVSRLTCFRFVVCSAFAEKSCKNALTSFAKSVCPYVTTVEPLNFIFMKFCIEGPYYNLSTHNNFVKIWQFTWRTEWFSNVITGNRKHFVPNTIFHPLNESEFSVFCFSLQVALENNFPCLFASANMCYAEWRLCWGVLFIICLRSLSLAQAVWVLSLCIPNKALRHEDVWGSGCIDLRILDLGASWWVVSFTPWPLYFREKSPPIPIS
jgi:hypothetical protein